MTGGDILDIEKLLVATLLAPDPLPGVDGIVEDRPNRRVRPAPGIPVAVPGPVVRGGGQDVVVGEGLGDGPEAVALGVESEDALDHWCCNWIGFKPVKPLAGRGLRGIGVRTGVAEAVPVGRAASQEPIALSCHGLHMPTTLVR